MAAPNQMPEFTQQDRLLRLHTCLGENVFLAESLIGWESLGTGGFSFEISALCSDAMLVLSKLPGSTVLVQMLCDDSRTELRPFHGYIRHFERVGSNGGLTRYKIGFESWLKFLDDRQDSFAFHDMSAIEIAEQIFTFYRNRGVHANWRWDVDKSLYPKRSLSVQYQESDMAFIERLFVEEGIAYRFEHEGDTASDLLGCHRLVMTDSNDRLICGGVASIPFQRSDATESKDSVQHWSASAKWLNGEVVRQSWDYRLHSMQAVVSRSKQPGVPGATDHDCSGPYSWIDAEQGERRARQHLDAVQVGRHQIYGRGTCRRLNAGMAFTLTGHGAASARDRWLCLRVEHVARNNFDARLRSMIEVCLGGVKHDVEGFDAIGDRIDTACDLHYRNRFIALPATQTYRPCNDGKNSCRLNHQPSVRGGQTAVVVGDGAPLSTDRDHRVKVQLHWQRGSKSASRFAHPSDIDNAPANTESGTWTRVGAMTAGGNWGSVWVPRVGQEVWIDFLEGAVDRPVVVRSLYNGQGHDSGPHSRIAGGLSSSTANSAAWFVGNDHDDVLHGFRTQDLASSQQGTEGFRQLLMDHTNDQSSIHVFTTDQQTGLVLGHQKRIDGNLRLSDLGHGSQLNTLAHGALRAGGGLLLSTDSARQQMDAETSLAVLEPAHDLVDQIAAAAGQEPADGKGSARPVSEAIAEGRELLCATAQGEAAGQGIGGGEGDVVAWGAPMLLMHGVSGISSSTPKSQIWVAGTHSVLTARADLNLTAQGRTQFVAGSGVSLYTQGDTAEQRPVDQTGIALHACLGITSLQAQTDIATLAAKRNVRLTSTDASAHIQGKTHLLLTAQGATLKLVGGNIELTAPGHVELKAGLQKWEGPKAGQARPGTLASGELEACALKDSDASSSAKGVH